MKLLPSRYIFRALQIATTIRVFGELLPTCRSAVFWLCAWPRLLGWKRRVNWLRVSDSAKKSQNLWGIDSAGNLLIVEIRAPRGETVRDPFASLTSHLQTDDNQRAWSAKELRASWHDSVTSAQKVVAVQSTHKRSVEEAFVKRQAAGNPPPILVVIVTSARYEFRLSDEGLKNLLLLEKLAGSARVALRAISGRFGLRGIRIHCWSPRPSASGSRRRRRLR